MTTPDQYAFNLESGAAERDRGIGKVTVRAEPNFITAGRAAVEQCCFTMISFTTDDVWALIPEEVRPHEPRAMAAIMKHAERQNWASPLAEFRPSERREAHRGPKRVWHSNLYQMRNALQPSYEGAKQEPTHCRHPDVFDQNGILYCIECFRSLI